MTLDWNIITMARDPDDGFVNSADWQVVAREKGRVVSFLGRTEWERPFGIHLEPYDKLTKKQVIGWVKDSLGDEGVANIETSLAASLNEVKKSAELLGVPWKQ